MKDKILEGELVLYSETGMEGGALAILDEKSIELKPPKHGLKENSKVWDNIDITKSGITSNPESYIDNTWLPARDPILDEEDYRISSLFKGEVYGDLNADKRLMLKYDFKIKYTHDRADELYGKGNWSFTGHNKEIMLKDGSKTSFGITCHPKRPYGIPMAECSRVTVTWENGETETNRLSNTLLVKQWGYNALVFLKETDYLKIKVPCQDEIICEGRINSIPLKTFSNEINGHFENARDGNNWKDYFRNGYKAELYRDSTTNIN